MMNEISQNVTGILSPQAEGKSGSVKPVQAQPAVEASNVTQIARGNQVEPSKLTQPAVVEEKEIEEAVEDLNEFVQSLSRQLQFTVDEESGKTIVRVIDADTGETIRDIPPDQILNMQKQLREASEELFQQKDKGVSLLFQDKA